MGAHLVGRSEGLPGLSPRARVVLFVMALHALDTGSRDNPPAVYWGGWQRLGVALGYTVWDAKAELAVARAVRELVAAGYVKVEGHGFGYRTAYRLLV